MVDLNRLWILFSTPILFLFLFLINLPMPAWAEQSLGSAAFEEANFIFEHADKVRYRHHHVPADEQVFIDGDHCSSQSDCSGFVSFVLNKVAAKHYDVVHKFEQGPPYPQAKGYAEFFASLPEDMAQNGWRKLNSYNELRRGDIIAWKNPRSGEAGHTNTGHVMIVAKRPEAVSEDTVHRRRIRFVSIPVIDSSSVDHFKPEKLPPRAGQTHRNGLGKGDVRIILDSQGNAIGYWEGTYWGEGGKQIHHPTLTDEIGFARLVPFHEQ